MEKRYIYADNAATTAMSDSAINAMLPNLKENFGNPSSLHTAGQLAKEALDAARATVAECINAEPSEIYFTSGGSEADNQAIVSAAVNGEKKGKKHIISTAFEHHAVLHTLKKLEKAGFEVTYLNVHENGVINVDELKAAIKPETALVTVMFANNEIGTVQPIEKIGEICRKAGVVFHTDAVQAAGHIPVDVVKQNVDMLSVSAHKFHGPKGVGFLYCRKGLLLNSLIEGGAQESRKRAGTENIPAIAGMAQAFKDAVENMQADSEKLIKHRDNLIKGLLKIPHSKLNGDSKLRLPNNVNISFEGIEGEGLLLHLDAKGICASSGSACTTASLAPSHVLLAIGLPHEVAHGSLRLSIGTDLTADDVEYVIKSVEEVVAKLRDMSPMWEKLVKGEMQHFI